MSKKTVANTPSDPTYPKVELNLGEQTYFLTFSFNSLAKAEELTGLNLLASLDLRNINASHLRAVVYAAMLQFQPDVTLEQVGWMITPGTIGTITEALAQAYLASLPKKEADPNAQTPETKN